ERHREHHDDRGLDRDQRRQEHGDHAPAGDPPDPADPPDPPDPPELPELPEPPDPLYRSPEAHSSWNLQVQCLLFGQLSRIVTRLCGPADTEELGYAPAVQTTGPERIGRYDVIAHLATGGMGQVYLARSSGPGGFVRHVVLKTLDLPGTDEEEAAAM